MQVGMVIHNDKRTQDERRYNSPTAKEIAVVFKRVDGKPPADRDIVGHLHIPENGNTFRRISTRQSMCDPMTYPLLLPNGEQGWNCNLPLRKKDGSFEHLDNEEDDPDEELAIEDEDELSSQNRVKKRKKESLNANSTAANSLFATKIFSFTVEIYYNSTSLMLM